MGSDLRYRPPEAPLDAYMALAQRLGFERFVFVQPSPTVSTIAAMLDAMRQIGTARCRGVVDLDETATEPATLQEWHRLGVRGIRVNVSPVRKPEPGLADAMRPRIRRLGALAAGLGWHLDCLTRAGWCTELLDEMRALPVDFSVAHLGLFPAADGVKQPGFQEFLALVGAAPRRCWVKLTGVYRMATGPDFADAAPMARALIAAAPDRIIWGSDYPHLSFHDKVGSVQLLNLLAQWAPDEATRRRILVDNPAALFGFG